MSSSYPSPPNTPSPPKVGSDRDLARQNERSPARSRTSALVVPLANRQSTPPPSPPTTPWKCGSVAAINATVIPAPMDLEDLKTRLELDAGKCGSPTVRRGNPPCQNPNPSDIEVHLRSIMKLNQASRELPIQLGKLAELALCTYHVVPRKKEARVKAWKSSFPVGDEKLMPIDSIEDQLNGALNCFPLYASEYTCVGERFDRHRTPCGFKIGGKKVLNGKKTIALLVNEGKFLHHDNLNFCLNVLAINVFCYNHTGQISQRVEQWKLQITNIYRANSVQERPPKLIYTTGLSRKLEGSLADFWDDTNDTCAFVKEIERDGPINKLACYPFIQRKMREPLKSSELADGNVYIYEVEGNKGFVKIGYTTHSIEHRSEQWKFQCNRVPKVLYPLGSSEKIPHANRVEGLCLAELKHRNVIVACEACPKRHTEWVQVPAAEAIAVIQKWTKWIHTAPYKDSKKILTKGKWENKITSWNLKDEERQRTNDMRKFMHGILAA